MTLTILAATAGATTVAFADTATDAFNAWNSAFLVKLNSDTYYATTWITQGTQRQGTWVGALDIAVAEDRYMYTHSQADRQLVNDLMTTFVAKEGTSWIKNSSWNDDMAWMLIAGLRAYQITGNEAWLKVVTDCWNATYDRGWDTKYAGGGIWEDMGHLSPWNKPSKCGLSNNPIVSVGVVLYQITGDTAYLDKCKTIYDWVRKSMFVPATGQIYGCVGFATDTETVGKLEGGNNAYDSGSFTEMADAMYRVTGQDSYHQDTLRAIDYRIKQSAILHDGGKGESQWAYRFTRGLADFCNFNDQWPVYQSYLQNNANAAWSKRNALNITWNDWTQTTDMPGLPGVTHQNDVVALCTSSAAAIWQQFPPPIEPLPQGEFELRNAGNQLSIAVQAASKEQSAPVVQDTFGGGAEFFWTFVPTAGNYYQIKNVNSGMLLNVGPLTGKQGSKTSQAAGQGLRPGSDRWLPVKNADNSFTFYNLSSVFALDVPANSAVPGTQLDQLAGNDSSAQKFELVAHVAVTGAGGGGAGSAAGGADATGGSLAATGGAGSVTVAGSTGSGAAAGFAGSAAGGPNAAGPEDANSSNGCSCRASGSGSAAPVSGGLALMALGVLMALRRRGRGLVNIQTRPPGARTHLIAQRWLLN